MNGISMTRQLMLAAMALLLAGQVQATAPRFSAAKLAAEAAPHLVAYEYPPLVFGDQLQQGVAEEIVKQALSAMGTQAPIEIFPSRSFAAQLLKSDAKTVGLLAEARVLPAEERKGLGEVKCLLLAGKYYYYRPARGEAMAKIGDLKALKGYTYGAIPGELTDAYAKAGIKVVVDEPASLFRKLKSGEIDFLGAFPPHAELLIGQLFPGEEKDFAPLPMQAFETAYSLWFNKEHQPAAEWQKTFAEGLKKLRHNGVYLEILKKHGLEKGALMQ